jgi:hypothetical protein
VLLALTLHLFVLAQADLAPPPKAPPMKARLLSTAAAIGFASLGELIVGAGFIGSSFLTNGDSATALILAGLALAPAGAWGLPYLFGGDGIDGLGWSYLGGAIGGILGGTLGYLYGGSQQNNPGALSRFVYAGIFGLVGQLAGSPTALGLAHYFKNPPQVAVLPVRGGGVFSLAMRF